MSTEELELDEPWLPGAARNEPYDIDPETGRYVHVFSPSTIEQFLSCPEQARQKLLRRLPYVGASAPAIGTAVHLGIEATIRRLMTQGELIPNIEAMDIAMAEYTRASEDPTFVCAPKHEGDKAPLLIWSGISRFFDLVLPHIRPVSTEQRFENVVLYEDDVRIILTRGLIDYIDEQWGVVDWKTSGKKYSVAEKQLQAIQPSVYLWAAELLGLIPPAAEQLFHFGVFSFAPRSIGEVQWVPITRTAGHRDWLRRQVLVMARTAETMPHDEWPLNDTSWKCHPERCGAWPDCKGRNITIQPKETDTDE